MALSKIAKTQVGLYWGKEGIALIETVGRQAVKSIAMPFNAKLESPDSPSIPEELKPTAILKHAVKEARIDFQKVNLTLSTRDFIFRSFTIPAMSPAEAKNVIDFEATKYIPIPLSELFYTHHAIPFSDNNQKSLRVLFFAARKDLLARYAGYIEQAGLEVEHIEPEPISLVRLLLQQKRITPRQSNAIIVLARGEGKLIIADNAIVQFVREFQLPEQLDDPLLIRAKLFNEVRNSLSFYARQNTQSKVDALFLLTAQPLLELDRDLASEFKKPATSLTLQEFLPSSIRNTDDMGLLPALGNAIREPSLAPWDFELAEKHKNLQKIGEAAKKKIQQYFVSGVVVVLCVLLGGLGLYLPTLFKKGAEQKIAALKTKLGVYESLQASDIEKLQTDVTAKLNSYQSIHLTSEISDYLKTIPDILPDQAWLKDLSITYQNRRDSSEKEGLQPTLTMSGYIYIPEANEQYRYATKMAEDFKTNDKLPAAFKNVNLDSMAQELYEGQYVVTAFRVTFQ